MIAMRTFGWSVLVLAAFAGCTKEPEPATTTEAPPATTTPAPEGPPPATPPAETKSATEKTAPPSSDLPKVEAPQPTPATKDEGKTSGESKTEENKSEGKAAAVSLSSEEVAEIKKLPEGEAERALKQQVCPVSGENLGSMGVPVKVSAEGQTFYLCCKGCNKEVKADPAAVVAKLKR